MNFEKDVISSSNEAPVLCIFSTSWCVPCKRLKSVLAENSRDDIKYVKIDVEEYPDIAAAYQIRSVPTLILFKNEKGVSRINGSMGRVELNNWLDSYI